MYIVCAYIVCTEYVQSMYIAHILTIPESKKRQVHGFSLESKTVSVVAVTTVRCTTVWLFILASGCSGIKIFQNCPWIYNQDTIYELDPTDITYADQLLHLNDTKAHEHLLPFYLLSKTHYKWSKQLYCMQLTICHVNVQYVVKLFNMAYST